MWKYEMDPMSIVEDTERTRFCPQTDGRTDGQTDKVMPVYPPLNFVEAGGIIRQLPILAKVVGKQTIVALEQQALLQF